MVMKNWWACLAAAAIEEVAGYMTLEIQKAKSWTGTRLPSISPFSVDTCHFLKILESSKTAPPARNQMGDILHSN